MCFVLDPDVAEVLAPMAEAMARGDTAAGR